MNTLPIVTITIYFCFNILIFCNFFSKDDYSGSGYKLLLNLLQIPLVLFFGLIIGVGFMIYTMFIEFINKSTLKSFCLLYFTDFFDNLTDQQLNFIKEWLLTTKSSFSENRYKRELKLVKMIFKRNGKEMIF